MRSFEPGFLSGQSVSHGLARTLRLLGEYKGKQDLWREQSPELLQRLTESARVESAESSNRIEGVTVERERLEAIVQGARPARDRSEQEIAGYRDVLATIHSNWRDMRLSPGLVLQLHRDLFHYAPGQGGRWKSVDNQIIETSASGRRIRFTPVPAYATADAMSRLHEGYAQAWAAGQLDPLLLVPAYVLDFLCIHPFLDGNGRMARLLSLLLLYQAGYEVGRYIGLERIVEQQREGYYDALAASSQQWHDAAHSLTPWWEFFLGVMLQSGYRELEQRVGALGNARGAKRQAVLDAIARLPSEFRHADVARTCPGVSRPTIERVLAELKAQGRIRSVRGGRGATWEKVD
ncbi:MAG: Fic family protein [Longimicrobiales bacterium]